MRASPMMIGFLVVLGACSMSEDEREAELRSVQRINVGLARGQAVSDLRAPSDSGRLIYSKPTHLSRETARNAGADQVWAPFGIATPDTVASSRVRTQRP